MRKPTNMTPLRQVRKSSGLSQKQFAEYLGINLHSYHSMELGRIGLTKKKAEAISQKTGATRKSIDHRTSQQALDFSGAPYTRASWDIWQRRGLDWNGPMGRVANVFDWLRFLVEIAARENKVNEVSFELAECVTQVMERLDLRTPVEQELRRSKVKVGLICTYGDLRRDGKLAKMAGFKDDPTVSDDAQWEERPVISYIATWEPQTVFPWEIAERLGWNQSTEPPSSP